LPPPPDGAPWQPTDWRCKNLSNRMDLIAAPWMMEAAMELEGNGQPLRKGFKQGPFVTQ